VIKSSSKVIVTFFKQVNLSFAMKPVIIVSTYPDQKTIKKIAHELVKKRLAACVNISKISSIYSWKGKIGDTSEFLAIFKTTQTNKNSLKKEIKKMHPYDVPEILEIDILSINQPYLRWLIESTN
jgi:periplasmic divalent cation tolerance protein